MRKRILLSIFILSTVILSGLSFLTVSCTKQPSEPPVAKIVPWVDSLFGDIRTDNYYWLREKENPEVIDYLIAENDYTNEIMNHSQAFQKKLYEEMIGRIKETDLSVPYKMGEYFYYSKTEEGKQYNIYCRKNGSLDADEEILLDANMLATGKEYFDLGIYEISNNQNLLAYSVDNNGSEEYTIFIKNLTTGELLDDTIPKTSHGIEWANDNKTIFYTTFDHTKRSDKLWRHELGTDISTDPMIFHEKDEKYFLYVSKTKSKKYLGLYLESNLTSEVRYLKADDPTGKFKVLHPREQGVEYSIYHHGNKFYIKTNENAKNFKIVTVPTRNPAKKYWKDFVPHSDTVKIDNVEVFKNHLVLFERINGLKQVHIINLKDNSEHYIEFPEPVYSVYNSTNKEFNTDLLRFSYYSLVTPKSIYDYNLNNKSRELLKQTEVLGGYDSKQYQSERIFAIASDGSEIPISLVYKKGIEKNGNNFLWLYGYGSYGASMDPYFSSRRLTLLDRGFIYAIAHIRGGGEMGRYWYEEGKFLNKKNTFTDFIACAEHLVNKGYTNSEKMVTSGGSAGGLLMGAVLNMRPDLFKAAIAGVPFVDVLTTMLDSTIPLTVTEFEEWGNPAEEEYYWYMKSYSPYDNVEEKAYPNILITAGLNDPRVQYWEPAKWTAKLRYLKTDNNLLLLKTNMGAGHGGASGRYDYLKEKAFEYAFIFNILGIEN